MSNFRIITVFFSGVEIKEFYGTVKLLKIGTPFIIAVILKVYYLGMCPKYTDRKPNSANPGQTAPSGVL